MVKERGKEKCIFLRFSNTLSSTVLGYFFVGKYPLLLSRIYT